MLSRMIDCFTTSPLQLVKISIFKINWRSNKDHLIMSPTKARTMYALFVMASPVYILNNLNSCWINHLNDFCLNLISHFTWILCAEMESKVFISVKVDAPGVWDELEPILLLPLSKPIPPWHIPKWTKQKRQRGSFDSMPLWGQYLVPWRNPQWSL